MPFPFFVGKHRSCEFLHNLGPAKGTRGGHGGQKQGDAPSCKSVRFEEKGRRKNSTPLARLFNFDAALTETNQIIWSFQRGGELWGWDGETSLTIEQRAELGTIVKKKKK